MEVCFRNSTSSNHEDSLPTKVQHIGNLEKRLWSSADVLRSTSNFASNEYFMPVMGLIFLRHACSRYLKVRDEILPTSITLKIAFASDGDMSSNLPT
ncbi:MAG: type I restriction-modification system subunit M N-terminal domain-containing protein [Sulfitobacter sp.]